MHWHRPFFLILINVILDKSQILVHGRLPRAEASLSPRSVVEVIANSQRSRNLQQYRMVYIFVCRLCSAARRNAHQSEEGVKMRVSVRSKIQIRSFKDPFQGQIPKISHVSHDVPFCTYFAGLRNANQSKERVKVQVRLPRRKSKKGHLRTLSRT